jgi:trigger factor
LNSTNAPEKPSENLEGQPADSGMDAAASDSSAHPEAVQDESVDVNNTALVREIDVEVPAEIVGKEFDSTIQRYSKAARVPGFRKGKVPAGVIRNRFSHEIRNDVLEALLPRYFFEALKKQGFQPVSEPQVHSMSSYEPGQPIRFKARFEIMPDIQLGNYREIKVEAPEVKVTDEDLDAALRNLQEQRATFDPVEEDRPLQDGDFAQISFEAVAKPGVEQKAEGESAEPNQGQEATQDNAIQPVRVDDTLVNIGESEFSDGLRGAKPGEERTFDVTYPEDFPDKRRAGKTLSFTAKVNAIKKKSVPALTDELVKEMGPEFETLEALKTSLRAYLLAQRRDESMQEVSTKIFSQLDADHNFPIPETMIQSQITTRLEQWIRSMAMQGVTAESLKRLDFKRLRSLQREPAMKEVKTRLLLEKIADTENIEATQEEIDQQVQELAQQTRTTPEEMHQRLIENGGLRRIYEGIRREKAMRFLYDNSTSNA